MIFRCGTKKKYKSFKTFLHIIFFFILNLSAVRPHLRQRSSHVHAASYVRAPRPNRVLRPRPASTRQLPACSRAKEFTRAQEPKKFTRAREPKNSRDTLFFSFFYIPKRNKSSFIMTSISFLDSLHSIFIFYNTGCVFLLF